MQKLKFALALPILGLAIAAGLLQLGYRAHAPVNSELYVPSARLVCFGFNAPALPLRMLNPIRWGPAFYWLPRYLFGFDTDDLFLLAGVVILWYLVGRAVDRRRRPTRTEKESVTSVIRYVLFVALAGLLLLLGVHDLRHPGYNNLHLPIGAFLTLAWSGVLLFISSRGFLRVFHDGLREHGEGPPSNAEPGGV